MKAAYKIGKETHPNELAYTQSTYTRLGLFINSFEQALEQYRIAYKQQSENSAEYQTITRRARLYVSHFIQVVNMAILRGELKPEIREFYGIDPNNSKLPPLASDQDLVDWGKKIIDGEFNRTSQGKAPITNPTIALVKVNYEQFFDAFTRQRVFQQNTARTLNKLNALRTTADEIILSIWNEVEAHFANEPAQVARKQAKKYGLVYVYRKNEMRELDLSQKLESIQMPSLFSTNLAAPSANGNKQ